MRGLDMTAVLSSFSGHIPKAFADKNPDAKIRRSPNWGHMPTGAHTQRIPAFLGASRTLNCVAMADYNTATIHHANYASVYMLDPRDALFAELGNKFVAKMADEWGTDHIYQTDTCVHTKSYYILCAHVASVGFFLQQHFDSAFGFSHLIDHLMIPQVQ